MSDPSARAVPLGLAVLVKRTPAEVFIHVSRGAAIPESAI